MVLTSDLAEGRPRPCCLIVEDQALVGLALEAYLEDSGWLVAGPLSTAAEALLWLTERAPDLAIVDFELKDGPCVPLLQALASRDIPFLIYSGHRPSLASLPAPLKKALWLEKPTAREALVKAIATVAPAPSEAAHALPR